jgi:hypothetical protein
MLEEVADVTHRVAHRIEKLLRKAGRWLDDEHEGGFAHCNDHCADPKTDINNCGSCGRVCAAPARGLASCVAGQCVISCDTGLSASAGTCVDTAIDANNCGKCGQSCSKKQTCTAHKCTPLPGWAGL